MPRIRRNLILCVALLLVPLLSACPRQEDSAPLAEEEVDSMSDDFVVEINRFDFMDVLADGSAPAATDQASESEEVAARSAMAAAADETAAEEGMEGEEDDSVPPRRGTILFDLMVRFQGTEAPEGIDLEFVHSDSSENEKGRYQEFVVTHEMQPGEVRREAVAVEVDDYEDGDAFSVALKPGI